MCVRVRVCVTIKTNDILHMYVCVDVRACHTVCVRREKSCLPHFAKAS